MLTKLSEVLEKMGKFLNPASKSELELYLESKGATNISELEHHINQFYKDPR
jgi:hypothetical protein